MMVVMGHGDLDGFLCPDFFSVDDQRNFDNLTGLLFKLGLQRGTLRAAGQISVEGVVFWFLNGIEFDDGGGAVDVSALLRGNPFRHGLVSQPSVGACDHDIAEIHVAGGWKHIYPVGAAVGLFVEHPVLFQLLYQIPDLVGLSHLLPGTARAGSDAGVAECAEAAVIEEASQPY